MVLTVLLHSLSILNIPVLPLAAAWMLSSDMSQSIPVPWGGVSLTDGQHIQDWSRCASFWTTYIPWLGPRDEGSKLQQPSRFWQTSICTHLNLCAVSQSLFIMHAQECLFSYIALLSMWSWSSSARYVSVLLWQSGTHYRNVQLAPLAPNDIRNGFENLFIVTTALPTRKLVKHSSAHVLRCCHRQLHVQYGCWWL